MEGGAIARPLNDCTANNKQCENSNNSLWYEIYRILLSRTAISVDRNLLENRMESQIWCVFDREGVLKRREKVGGKEREREKEIKLGRSFIKHTCRLSEADRWFLYGWSAMAKRNEANIKLKARRGKACDKKIKCSKSKILWPRKLNKRFSANALPEWNKVGACLLAHFAYFICSGPLRCHRENVCWAEP